jgi:hypothetical protein
MTLAGSSYRVPVRRAGKTTVAELKQVQRLIAAQQPSVFDMHTLD